MGAISVVLLVAFVIICVLLVLLVLVQDQESSGMGGMLGGGNSTAFGSHSASVLTKVTVAFVALFFISTLALALLNKKSSRDDLAATALESGMISDTEDSGAASPWWKDEPQEEAPVEDAAPAEAEVSEPESSAEETAPAEVSASAAEQPQTGALIMNSEEETVVSE